VGQGSRCTCGGEIVFVSRKALGFLSDGESSSNWGDEVKARVCGCCEDAHTGPPSLLQPQQELGFKPPKH